jgi:hypothetical protein
MRHRDLGHLEDDRPAMADNPGADLHQPVARLPSRQAASIELPARVDDALDDAKQVKGRAG